ncbi:MAG: SpoIIE family protein phosphatase [Planctomycetaceae bacterium]|nr:SpoIIE family protein phosphatase [Planctomycetaceae bacterium]
MSNATPQPTEAATTDRVLLVDDQAIVGEAVRRMIAAQGACEYRSVQDPQQAVAAALEFRPTVILQDIEMPAINGLDLLARYQEHAGLRDVPVVMLTGKEDPAVKADAFARGASDYLVKLPHPVELVARIRHHSRGYRMELERNAAYEALRASEAHMKAEIQRAASYVRSLLDEPIDGAVRADWRFVPCESLGGDVFGYHWIDDDHLAAYVIDVSGHGVGPALMGVSAMNLIRSGSLERPQLLDPTRVLAALNAAFQMSRHDGMYFTVWYGVYSRVTRELAWSGGGHPPSFLVRNGVLRQLESTTYMVGVSDDYDAPTERVTIEPGDRLYLFSDGAFEIQQSEGRGIWGLDAFRTLVEGLPAEGVLDAVVVETRRIMAEGRGIAPSEAASATWDDDFSLIEFRFN